MASSTLVGVSDKNAINEKFLSILPDDLQNKINSIPPMHKDFKDRCAYELAYFMQQNRGSFVLSDRDLLLNLLCDFNLAVKQIQKNPLGKFENFFRGMSNIYKHEQKLQDQFVEAKIKEVTKNILELAEKKDRRKLYLNTLQSILQITTAILISGLVTDKVLKWCQIRSQASFADLIYNVRKILPRAFLNELSDKGFSQDRAAFENYFEAIFNKTNATIQKSLMLGFFWSPETTFADFSNNSNVARMLNDFFEELAILREYAKTLELKNTERVILAATAKITREIELQEPKLSREVAPLVLKAIADVSAGIMPSKTK